MAKSINSMIGKPVTLPMSNLSIFRSLSFLFTPFFRTVPATAREAADDMASAISSFTASEFSLQWVALSCLASCSIALYSSEPILYLSASFETKALSLSSIRSANTLACLLVTPLPQRSAEASVI